MLLANCTISTPLVKNGIWTLRISKGNIILDLSSNSKHINKTQTFPWGKKWGKCFIAGILEAKYCRAGKLPPDSTKSGKQPYGSFSKAVLKIIYDIGHRNLIKNQAFHYVLFSFTCIFPLPCMLPCLLQFCHQNSL